MEDRCGMVSTLTPAVIAAISMAWLGACGDDLPATSMPDCGLHNPDWARIVGCSAAIYLAAREGRTVTVQQDLVDKYFPLIRAVWIADPLTQLGEPARSVWDTGYVLTENEQWIAAWEGGSLETGIASVDATFGETLLDVVSSGVTFLPPKTGFSLRFRSQVSLDVIADRLRSFPDTIVETYLRPHNDTHVRWEGLTAHLDIVGGWGDCPPGCAFFHYWSATVTPDLQVTVIDLGGDPIPPDIRQLATDYVDTWAP